MLPCLAAHNVANIRSCCTETLSYFVLFSTLRPHFTNINNVLVGKLMSWVRFSKEPDGRRSAFFRHVLEIGRLCTQPEVSWINAQRVIPIRTIMANILAFWDWAIMNFPTYAVCAPGTHTIKATSVPAIIRWSKPQPALIWLAPIDFGPKQFFDGFLVFVAANKAHRLSLDMSVPRAGFSCNRRGIATSTFTEFRGDFLCSHGYILPRFTRVETDNSLTEGG